MNTPATISDPSAIRDLKEFQTLMRRNEELENEVLNLENALSNAQMKIDELERAWEAFRRILG